jgi:hypothetical protein
MTDRTIEMIIANMDVDCCECMSLMAHTGEGVFECPMCKKEVHIFPGVIK